MLREIAARCRRDNVCLQQLAVAAVTAAVLLAVAAASAAAQGLPNLAALQTRGASISALVVDLQQGEVVASLDPDRQLIPASVTKLVTAARALELWGADHRFSTRLVATAIPRQGTLEGDLVLVGGGDPAMTEEALQQLAREVARLGIREIGGDVVIDASRFGQVACSHRDRCQASEQSAHSYAAPLSAAGVNFSTISIVLKPSSQAGQQVWVQPEPFELPSFQVSAQATTSPGGGIDLTAVHRNLGDHERTEIAGALPLGNGGVSVRRSVGHPERLTGELLRAFLEREGVALRGGLHFAFAPVPYQVVLAEHESDALGDILKGMLYYSNNFSADVMALELAHTAGRTPPLGLPAAGALLGDYVRALAAGNRFAGGPGPAAHLRDGSGLDPDNRLSARELVSLLDHVYGRLDLLQPLLGSLSVPAHARGTLLSGQDPVWSISVAGKTGGLNVPVSVTSYAGYLRFQDGGWGAFAFIVNGAAGQPVARADAFEAMRRDVAQLR